MVREHLGQVNGPPPRMRLPADEDRRSGIPGRSRPRSAQGRKERFLGGAGDITAWSPPPWGLKSPLWYGSPLPTSAPRRRSGSTDCWPDRKRFGHRNPLHRISSGHADCPASPPSPGRRCPHVLAAAGIAEQPEFSRDGRIYHGVDDARRCSRSSCRAGRSSGVGPGPENAGDGDLGAQTLGV